MWTKRKKETYFKGKIQKRLSLVYCSEFSQTEYIIIILIKIVYKCNLEQHLTFDQLGCFQGKSVSLGRPINKDQN